MVIDPNRHKLAVWEKSFPTSDFVTSGQALNASVFTNGPMVHSRVAGNDYVAAAGYIVQGSWNSLKASFDRPLHSFGVGIGRAIRGQKKSFPMADISKQKWNEAADDWFGGVPYGDVVGASQNIDIHGPVSSTPLGYFGRDSGTSFESYKIGLGNPAGLAEASGGLYAPAILNYQVTPDTHGSNQWFYWGLAPLKPQGPEGAELRDALTAYAAAGASKPVTGLIVGLFYHSGGGGIVQHLADIGVRDAVKLDGSDSVLLGHDKTVLWGNGMTGYKRVWMRWGFAFYPY